MNKKIIGLVLVGLICIGGTEATSYALENQNTIKKQVKISNGWSKGYDGKWYYYRDGAKVKDKWLLDNGTWYYLTQDGSMKIGWLKDNGKWYYLNQNGSMKKGWLQEGNKWYYLTQNGSMKIGWLSDNGIWYYFYSNGQMAHDTVIDGYKLDSSGVWVDSKKSFEVQVLDLVNKERAKVGLKALKLNSSLTNVAKIKSKDMHDLNYFSHNSPTYGSPFDMMQQFNITYRAAAENIAAGYTTPESVMTGWMNSPGHKANILNKSFTEMGIGIYKGDRGYKNYWTQMFIGN